MDMQKILTLGVVVVAGGSSRRYGRGNKLMEMLGDAPVFIHSLRNYSGVAAEIVLVISQEFEKDYLAAVKKYIPDIPLKIVYGGDTRALSVSNGINALGANIRYAAICDAARPLAKAEQLVKMFAVASEHKCGVISGRMLNDSIKRVDKDGFIIEPVDREGIFRAETPQLFEKELLQTALRNNNGCDVTDDAEAVRRTGARVLVLNDANPNPKITVAEDIDLLRKMLTS